MVATMQAGRSAGVDADAKRRWRLCRCLRPRGGATALDGGEAVAFSRTCPIGTTPRSCGPLPALRRKLLAPGRSNWATARPRRSGRVMPA
jgi:hypothetical protein